MSLDIAVAGANGRMGRMLVQAVLDASDCRLTAALASPESPHLGTDAAAFLGQASGVTIGSDLAAALGASRVLIDFTRPQGTLRAVAACREAGVNMVIGTTGFSADERAQIEAAAADIAIVMAPNMSVGVNLVLRLLDTAARALSEGYDIEIIEAHHRHKVDAPSGTALRMGEVVAKALGRDLRACAVYGREGVSPHNGGERDPSTIGFATIRGGDIVGDHTVLFAGIGERIEISHRSSSRQGYAQGSLRAARFLQDRRTGLFGMDQVLGWA